LFLAERYGPVLLGGLFFAFDALWLHITILDVEWGNRLLDRVIQASAVGAAFWGVAITLLIGMDTKRVVGSLKRLGYYRDVVRYFGESLFACFGFLLLSVLLEPSSKMLSPVFLSALWAGACVWAVASTARTYYILTALLMRAADE